MVEQGTYSAAERGRIIATVREALTRGRPVKEAAASCGITQAIFYRWVREAAKAPRVAKRGRPAAERAKIVAAVRERVAKGERTSNAAKAEGISDATFYIWAREVTLPAMRPVTIGPSATRAPAATLALTVAPALPAIPAPQPLTLIAPGGYRIEGLGVEAAAALLRALS